MKSRSPFLFVFFIALGFMYLNSCSNAGNEELSETALNASLSRGLSIMEKQCFSCHSPDAGQEQRVAPPMIAVKRHYVDENTAVAELTTAIHDYINEPTEEKSKMPGARERFGMMPKLALSEVEVEDIARYLIHTEIEAPGWFEEHYQKEHGKQETAEVDKSTAAYGKSLALATKSVLGSNLLHAIQSKGTAGAVEFCNTRAIHLTDSMAEFQGADIKRVSDQPRNPNNQANEQELEYIREAKERLSRGEDLKPYLLESDGQMTGYYPIVTNEMCLQCHGTPNEQVAEATLDVLEEKYPGDKALGYVSNQLRGIWVVNWER